MQKNTLWSGGRLEAALNQSMADLNRSLDIDKRMAEQDIRGSQAWAKGICKCGILTDSEFEQIHNGRRSGAAALSIRIRMRISIPPLNGGSRN